MANVSNAEVVLLGVGVVFFGLICIVVLCKIAGAIMQNMGSAAPAAAAAPAPAAAPAGATTVSAPMPGNILDVRVSEGQAVKKGDVLMILEAMKMENEIMAPCDGTVSQICTSKGSSVGTGAALCVIG